MDNNIKNYKKEINECTNIILISYKDLLVSYEDSRQAYENIVQNTTEILRCSGIYARNGSATSTKWLMVKLDGTLMYQSDKYKAGEICKIDLRRQNRVQGIQFRLKANVIGGDDSESTMILEYDPNAEFLKFELNGSIFKTHLTFAGPVPAPYF